MASALVGCGELWSEATVVLDAELCSVEDVRLAVQLFPRGWFSSGNRLLRGPDVPEDPSALLPMTLSAEEQVGGDLPARAAVLLPRAAWGQLAWVHLSWPAIPELGLEPAHTRTGVQACFHSDSNHNPAPAHTVYIHVHPLAEDRAQHLARQVGRSIVGPSENGW
ncbi:hypothetical protein [Streptomyces sp. NPDC090112]|uniref:hypothetical protein n=1 Tax=Streptomyces sp. NPDC090112 TaxID=3365949 RepID=UPI003820F41A